MNGFLSWFSSVLVISDCFFCVCFFFDVTILSGSFLGGRMFKPVNSLILEKFLGEWLTMVASVCCVV